MKNDNQLRWRDARSGESFLSGPRPAQEWSTRRCRIVEQGYGQWLSFLARNGQLDPAQSPEARAIPERVETFVTQLQQRGIAPWSVAMMVQGVQRMLAVIAPSHESKWLRTLVSNLKRLAKPTREKLAHMVDPRQLYHLGLDLMKEASRNADRDSYFAATMGRDGLMIALLASCPVRIANLTQIAVGQHLLFDVDRYRLSFDDGETKTGRPFDGELPPELTPYVDEYLRVHRANLLARGDFAATDRLWINRWGQPLQEPGIRAQIEKPTSDAFGRHVWPHLFRAIAATGFVDHAPDDAPLVPDLLGHANTQTAHKYYILSTGTLAHKAIQSSLSRRREAAAARLKAAR
jgi:integrase